MTNQELKETLESYRSKGLTGAEIVDTLKSKGIPTPKFSDLKEWNMNLYTATVKKLKCKRLRKRYKSGVKKRKAGTTTVKHTSKKPSDLADILLDVTSSNLSETHKRTVTRLIAKEMVANG